MLLVKLNKILRTSNILKSKVKYYSSLNAANTYNGLALEATSNLNDDSYDSLIIIGKDFEKDLDRIKDTEHFKNLKAVKDAHKKFDKDLTFIVSNNKRLIYSPTGPLNKDFDDVRAVVQASKNAIKKAIATGSKKPLILNTANTLFTHADKAVLLGCLEAAYNPLEVREAKKIESLLKVDKLGYFSSNLDEGNKLMRIINGLELGRIIARDIGSADPERMNPQNVHNYVTEQFKSTEIKMTVVEGQEVFEKEYPSFAAVNRAANVVPRHRGRIIKLEYNPTGDSIENTLFLVGKGMTYDTGGADIKTGGFMTGMHKDKCGAAFVAGFFKTLSILKPKGLKAVGYLCLTRNSVGEECYVTDEIITARSKKRIRIGNTDAEGRMAICDVLNEAKDLALNEKNPQLFTIATLTGHCVLSYGNNYSAIMSNGPARALKTDHNLEQSGEAIGDPYEISRIRKEDYEMHKGKTEYEDLTQIQNKKDRSRGHQGPAAFLIMASGLDKHGSESEKPLPYSHIDIAGSAGPPIGDGTAAPLPSFFVQWVLPKL